MIDPAALLARRTSAGMSQRRLAKLAGVNSNTIKRIEDGADAAELPLGVLGRIADALQVEPGELLLRRLTADAFDDATVVVGLDDLPLDHNAARLLRRIHRGEDVRRSMTKAERELTLPALINRGIVEMTNTGAMLRPDTSSSLGSPMSRSR